MKRFAIVIGALVLPVPAMAEVKESSASGFVIQLGVDVPAAPQASWDALVMPRKWWSAEHSYSSDAGNFSLDPRASGCFCEVLPNKTSPKAAPRGSVEHMRVVYAEQPRALRMTGALGPLQAGAGTGTLTVILKPEGEGTRLLWEYAYGGYVRGDVPAMAKAVDGVLAEQLLRLARLLGGRGAAPVAKAEPQPIASEPSGDSDFVSEMEAGIGAASAGQAESPAPAPALNPEPPEKAVNDQGFVGR
jgi:uncharacterized protein YndB with AHSA1/START domain